MSDDQIYSRARQKVKVRKKFYTHVITWVLMSVMFITFNLFTTDYFWAIFPILAWGIGVAFHGIQVFSDEWEEYEIEKEFNRMRSRNVLDPDQLEREPGQFENKPDKDFV